MSRRTIDVNLNLRFSEFLNSFNPWNKNKIVIFCFGLDQFFNLRDILVNSTTQFYIIQLISLVMLAISLSIDLIMLSLNDRVSWVNEALTLKIVLIIYEIFHYSLVKLLSLFLLKFCQLDTQEMIRLKKVIFLFRVVTYRLRWMTMKAIINY